MVAKLSEESHRVASILSFSLKYLDFWNEKKVRKNDRGNSKNKIFRNKYKMMLICAYDRVWFFE